MKKNARGVWTPKQIVDLQLSYGERYLLAQVVFRASLRTNNGLCSDTNAELGKAIGMKSNVVSETLAKIHKKGFVSIFFSGPNGAGRSIEPARYLLYEQSPPMADRQNPASNDVHSHNEKPEQSTAIPTPSFQENRTGATEIQEGGTSFSEGLYIDMKIIEKKENISKKEIGENAYPPSPLREAVSSNTVFQAEKAARSPTIDGTGSSVKKPETGSKADRIKEHFFSESIFYDRQVFITALNRTEYEVYDLTYYHEKLKNWADSGSSAKYKKADWLATARNFMLGDTGQNHARLAKNFTPNAAQNHATNTTKRSYPERQSTDEFVDEITKLASRKYGNGYSE